MARAMLYIAYDGMLELLGQCQVLAYLEKLAADREIHDLFVLSSESEGLPTVVIEALEQGTPVVSTDCPSGPAEILEGGKYGTLVPVGDAAAMARAMEDALGRKHDHEALKRRAADFSVDKAADAYLDLLLPGLRGRAAA